MPQKILFIYYQNLKPGGVARVMINLANELCEKGNDVSILFLMEGENTFYKIDPRIKIHTLNSFGHWGFNKVNPFLDKYLKKFRYHYNLKKYIYDFGQWDVMNEWLKKNHSQFDTIISCWYKLSAQITINEKIAKKTFAWEHSNFEVGGKIWGNLLRPRYKKLRGIICINKASVDYYKALNTNTFLIPNIVGEPFDSIKTIDFESKENQLIYVGRLDEDKNVRSLIETVEKTDLGDFKFKIIGDGPELEPLRKIVIEKNLSSQILFMGRLPIDEIRNELLKSKIFLFMSKSEAFGMVLLEALFTGNALISYDCNYGPADIVNEKNGYLIAMNDKNDFQEKLQSLINSPDLLHHLNRSSIQDAQYWQKKNITAKWGMILNAKKNISL